MDTLSRTGIVVPKSDGSDSTTAFRLSTRSIGAWVDTYGAIALPPGTLGARPTAAKFGRIYKPTDSGLENIIYFDDGTTWWTIGEGAATDAAPSVGSLRTLGAGSNQAAPGDSTAVGIATAVSADLRDWCRPGLEVPGQSSTITSVSAGPTTIVAGPSSGSTRAVKSLLISAPTAGMVVTLTLASVTLATFSFTTPGLFGLDCLIPVVATENLQATVTGGTAVLTAGWGTRTDLVVKRHALVSGSTSGTLIASSGGSKTIAEVWLANPTTTPSAATISVGGVAVLSGVAMPGRSLLTLDNPIIVPASTAVTWAGDSATAITYMLAGR